MALFNKATKSQSRLRMAIAGPAGSGKTWSMLAIAQGLGTRIAVIDTEHGGASHYADHFPFDCMELTDFHPERYIEAIIAADHEGYEVLGIDSLSHAWTGKGGVLELVEEHASKSETRNTFTAWGAVTPIQTRLVDTILQANCHIIVTLRTKTEYTLEEDRRGKKVPKKIGLAPIQRAGMEYEFDVFGLLDERHTLTITKSRLHSVADHTYHKPGKVLGTQILADLMGTVSPQALPTPAKQIADLAGDQADVQAHLTAARHGGTAPRLETPQTAQITAFLQAQGSSDEAIVAWWAKQYQRFPDLSPGLLTALYEQLQDAAATKTASKGRQPRPGVAKGVQGILDHAGADVANQRQPDGTEGGAPDEGAHTLEGASVRDCLASAASGLTNLLLRKEAEAILEDPEIGDEMLAAKLAEVEAYAALGRIRDPRRDAPPAPSTPPPASAWRDILTAHKDQLPPGKLRADCGVALSTATFPERAGNELAGAVLDALAAASLCSEQDATEDAHQ